MTTRPTRQRRGFLSPTGNSNTSEQFALLEPGYPFTDLDFAWIVEDTWYVLRSIELSLTPVACPADLTTGAVPGQAGYGVPDGVLSNDDFFYYLAQYSSGNLAVADLTAGAIPGQPGYGVPNGILNNDDFFYYLAIFSAGCP